MGNKKYIVGGVIVVIVAIAIGLLASSFKRLRSDEVGLKYDVHQNKLGNNVMQEGLHTGPPGFVFLKFPKIFKTIVFKTLSCLNKDGLTIKLNVQFQYRANSKDLKLIIKDFKDHDTYVKVLKNVAISTVHDACSEFNVTQFQKERGRFKTVIFTKLQANFKEFYGIVNNIVRPSAYETVIRQKQTAKQNIDVALSERPRIKTEATTKLKEAETQALITIQTAETQARISKSKAQAEADAIKNAYNTEAKTYKDIMIKQNLTIEGLLTYLSIRSIQSAVKPVQLGIDTPAKTSFP
eukprot:gene17304-19037_t